VEISIKTCLEIWRLIVEIFMEIVWRDEDFTMEIFIKTSLEMWRPCIKIFIEACLDILKDIFRDIEDMEKNYYFF
jgi:hypothetical protein